MPEDIDSFVALKKKLHPWREITLLVNELLLWEKPFFPAIIAGATTFIYLVLYCMDLSNLTLFPLLLALVLIADFGVPFITPKIFDQTKWTGDQEKAFEKICENVSQGTDEVTKAVGSIFEAKEKSPKLFFVAAVTILISLSWLGSWLNGIFLAWVITLSLLMIPGLKKNGALDKVIQLVMSKTKSQ